MKKVYKFILVVLILILLGWIIYFLFSKSSNPTTQTTEPASTTTEDGASLPSDNSEPSSSPSGAGYGGSITDSTMDAPSVSLSSFVKLSDEPAKFIWELEGIGDVFYVTNDDRIIVASQEKDQDTQVSGIHDIQKVEPNADGSLVLISFGTDSNRGVGIFDSKDRAWRPLPNDIFEATWGKSNSEIFALSRQKDGDSLVSVDLQKTPFAYKTFIKDVQMKDVQIEGKSPDALYLVEKGGVDYPSSVWQYDMKKNQIVPVIENELGLFIKLGRKQNVSFLYSQKNGFRIGNINLSIENPSVLSTVPYKCDGNLSGSVCFVPQNSSFSLFDLLLNKVYTKDSLYFVDPAGTEEVLEIDSLTKNTPIDAAQVIFDNGKVYFINKYDNTVYAFL